MYIFVSNESDFAVYFDNLGITHTRGPILEETHYYPFGLTMNGISGRALSFGKENSYRFNGGNEYEGGLGVNYYGTYFRQFDPQIGKFTSIDILSESQLNFTPYHFGFNNPILFNDPLGDRPPSDVPTYLPGTQGLYKLPNGRIVGWNEVRWYLENKGYLQNFWSASSFNEGEIYSWGPGTSRSGKEGLRIYFSFVNDREKMDIGIGRAFMSFEGFQSFQYELEEMDPNPVPWYDHANNLIGWASAGVSVFQSRIYGFTAGVGMLSKIPGNAGYWVTQNGFYRSMSGAGAATAAELKTISSINKFNTVAKVGFYATAAVSAVSIYDELTSGDPDYGKVAKSTTNVVMAGIGAFGGPIGAGVSLIYFGGGLLGWW